ncbi:pentatricopeptide repeat-containing protein [Tanacetum coccineum]
MHKSGVEPDTFVLNTMLNVYGRMGHFKKMEEVLAVMESRPYVPDISTYNILINMYGRAGYFEQMEEIFRLLPTKNLQKDVVTWTSRLGAYSRKKQYTRCLEIFEEMITDGCYPDGGTQKAESVNRSDPHRPSTPQQNGVAERKNRTIMNMVRSMLTEKQVPKVFWPEAVRWSVHILNRCPTVAVQNQTPEEAWSGVKPAIDYFRVFGCGSHAHVPDQSEKIIVSRDVIFEEDESWSWGNDKEENMSSDLEWGDDHNNNEDERYNDAPANSNEPGSSSNASPTPNQESSEIGSPFNDGSDGTNSPSPNVGRARKTPVWMKDYVTGDVSTDDEVAAMVQLQDRIAIFCSEKDLAMCFSEHTLLTHTVEEEMRFDMGNSNPVLNPIVPVDMWAVQHWRAGKRLLRYLKGTTELGIFYKRKSKESLEVYTDSDYAGDMDDRRSTSGSAFLLGSAASRVLVLEKTTYSNTLYYRVRICSCCIMCLSMHLVKKNFGGAWSQRREH